MGSLRDITYLGYSKLQYFIDPSSTRYRSSTVYIYTLYPVYVYIHVCIIDFYLIAIYYCLGNGHQLVTPAFGRGVVVVVESNEPRAMCRLALYSFVVVAHAKN